MPHNESGVNPERLRSLLEHMVNIYSPSGKEEEVISFVAEHLRSHGVSVQLQEVDEQRCNLIAIPEGRDQIELCLVGHVDTVAAYDLDDYGFEMVDEEVHGLGTVDMKSGCAAMVEAFGGGEVTSWGSWAETLGGFEAGRARREDARAVFERFFTEEAFVRRALSNYTSLCDPPRAEEDVGVKCGTPAHDLHRDVRSGSEGAAS